MNIKDKDFLNDFSSFLPDEENLQHIDSIYPFRSSNYYLSLIDKKNPDDAIAKTVIPSLHELDEDGMEDTSGESDSYVLPGLQHKYRETALFMSTNQCFSYCRYCFRRRFVGKSADELLHNFEDALHYVKEHTEISNVLISGGDPLTLPFNLIEKFLSELAQLEHLRYIRISTKAPVTFPDVLLKSPKLVELFSHINSEKPIIITVQFNHPAEITAESAKAVQLLTKTGIEVSNQGVLLRGVNDTVKTMTELLGRLVEIHVNPYYIYQCRPVKRAKNLFQVPLPEAVDMINATRRVLDGYAKRFRFVMSHYTGKIEILARDGNTMYFMYHQARNPEVIGKVFTRQIQPHHGWLSRELEGS